MEFRNYTPFPPITFESLGIDGEPFQVVILRGTFKIIPNAPLKPIPDQQPIITSDKFYGEPNISSIKFESDLAPYKPKSDIIINATSYPPGKKILPYWMVSAQVGKLQKQLLVTGPRYWQHRLMGGWKITDPEPCKEVPIRYEYAYGGQWKHEKESSVYEQNPIGLGYVNMKYLDKNKPIPAPRIMSSKQQVMELGNVHKPEGFSAMMKSWLPRRKYAGTYDEKWIKERHPLMPKNFDYAFYNCAHPDMIYDGYLIGNEQVVLKYLHSEHENLSFFLPDYRLGLLLRYKSGAMAMAKVELDTLHIDAPENRVYLVWRSQFDVGESLRVLEARMVIPMKKEKRRG